VRVFHNSCQSLTKLLPIFCQIEGVIFLGRLPGNLKSFEYIARGDYKQSPSDPKVWFSSMKFLAQVLSTHNKLLLELIAQAKPQSVIELAQLSGCHKSNLSRTLCTIEHYGLVFIQRKKSSEICPRVTFDHLRVDLYLSHENRV